LVFSYWTDKPWFLTEGKLAAVLITPSLGVPNWSVIYIINTAPSGDILDNGDLFPRLPSNVDQVI
jgi:hypothetical protein